MINHTYGDKWRRQGTVSSLCKFSQRPYFMDNVSLSQWSADNYRQTIWKKSGELAIARFGPDFVQSWHHHLPQSPETAIGRRRAARPSLPPTLQWRCFGNPSAIRNRSASAVPLKSATLEWESLFRRFSMVNGSPFSCVCVYIVYIYI